MKKIALNRTIFTAIGIIIGITFYNQIIPNSFAKESDQHENNQYQKCLTVTTPKPHLSMHFNAGKPPEEDRMVSVPPGWNPVGGYGPGERGNGYIILCK